MSEQSNFLKAILQVLISSNRGQQAPREDWRNVTMQNAGPYSATGFLQGAVSSLLGPTLGGIINRFVIGSEFTRSGNFKNELSGILLPVNGRTYGGAFLNFLQDSRTTATAWNRQRSKKQLQDEFYRQYFRTFYPEETQTQIRQRISGANKNAFQPGSLLSLFADPAQISRTLQNMQIAQAGVMQWSTRRNPLDPHAVTRANAMSNIIKDMSIEAQRAAVYGASPDKSYAGFSGGAVSQLSGILANTSDVLGSATGNDLKNKISKFKDRVRATTQALKPLRDILGQDITRMVDTLQGITGQNIAQLSPEVIRNISTRLVDAQRYSPMLSTGQIAALGSTMQGMLANQGIRGYAGLGAGAMGASVAGSLVPGNSAYGMTASQFQADTLNAYASSQGSRGTDFIAMAYSLWKQKNPKGSISDFKQLVAEQQAQGVGALDAAQKIAGVSSRAQLMKGLEYQGYRQALSSGDLASIGVTEQWNQAKKIKQLQLLATGRFTRQEIDTAMAKLNAPGVLSELSRTGNVNNVAGLDQTSRRVINFAVNTDPAFLAEARRATQIKEEQDYARANATVREAFADLDNTGGTGWNTFFNRFSKNWSKVDQSTRAAFAVIGQQLYGTQNMQDTLAKNRILQKQLGQAGMSQVLRYGFFGSGRSDQKFKENLRQLIDPKATRQQKAQAQRYILSAVAIGSDQELKDRAMTKNSQKAYSDYIKQVKLAETQTDNNKRLERINIAKSRFSNRLRAQARLQKLRTTDASDFSDLNTKSQVQKLLKIEASGKQVTQETLKGNKKVTSLNEYERLKAQLGTGDKNADVMNTLTKVLNELLQWLKERK